VRDKLTGAELASAIRDMAQRPDAEDVVGRVGHMLFGPQFRYSVLPALDRWVAKAHHALPVKNVSVGTSAVQLAERDPARIQLLIANLGAAIVYIGSDGRLTVGAPGDQEGGWPIFANTIQVFDRVNTAVWAISSAAGQDVRVLDLSG
jgi:hypothetical protein